MDKSQIKTKILTLIHTALDCSKLMEDHLFYDFEVNHTFECPLHWGAKCPDFKATVPEEQTTKIQNCILCLNLYHTRKQTPKCIKNHNFTKYQKLVEQYISFFSI